MYILQDEGDSLLESVKKRISSPDGPRTRCRGDKGIACSGKSLDIRMSFERILPKSFVPKPTLLRGETSFCCCLMFCCIA
jgi:hypothetical protein